MKYSFIKILPLFLGGFLFSQKVGYSHQSKISSDEMLETETACFTFVVMISGFYSNFKMYLSQNDILDKCNCRKVMLNLTTMNI